MVGGYFHFRNRDERLLRALISELEVMVSKRPGKSNALSLLDAATPERVFAPKVIIISDTPKIKRDFTLKELGQILLTVKKSCRSAALDIEIDSMDIQSESAIVCTNGMFSGDSARNGSFREVRDLTLECKKFDGKWKICTIKAVAVIKR